MCIERDWQAIDERKFGIGNISVAGGASRRDQEVDVNFREVGIVGACALISLAQSAKRSVETAEAKVLSGRYQV